jgi:hypothetical protein
MHRCLGEPLPHQLANAPRAHPLAIAETIFQLSIMRLKVLFGISSGFPKLSQTKGQVAHVLLTRPPLTSEESKLSSSIRSTCMY